MIAKYLKGVSEIYKTHDFLEHTFRTPFETLLIDFIQNKKYDFKVIHEPKREEFGAPDFKIIDKANNTIGYIECKEITENINNLIASKQIQKYLKISNNLIFTNYLDFILFKNGNIYAHCSIASVLDLKNKPKIKEEKEFEKLLDTFFLTTPEKITNKEKLSFELAKRTEYLHDCIRKEMNEDKEKNNHFYIVYNIFKTMINDLKEEQYIDMYSQIISFGLLFFRLSKDTHLTKENIAPNIPHFIPLLKDVFHNARFDRWHKETLWVLDEILILINNIDIKVIKESLSYKQLSLLKKRDANLKDPFLFFYEDFLANYDKNTKIARGVFYTPESVVSFIVRSLDVIIKEKLGIKKGFLEQTIKILDFATGTGTFILALIEFIKTELWVNHEQGLWNLEVNDFILKNIFGFELLVVPYIICHLRIHEYLESYGFHYSGEKERAGIYLTNTLENRDIALTKFFQDIDEEIQLSSKIKSNEDILVIMGNPPYSVSSSNKTPFIENLMFDYKKSVRTERNIQPLSDDYIKFIRFAHWKMEKVDKGVIGVITNNSFLDGIIHRGMREELQKTFDKIYILNLHGNSNIGDVCPDGSKDENVFDIKQGVAISFFIKTGKKRNDKKGIYYCTLQGLRDFKYDFLYNNTLNSTDWTKLEINTPCYWFKYKDLSQIEIYNKGFILSDIFGIYNIGIATGKDSELVSFDYNKLKEKYNISPSKYYYRPFDCRYTIFDRNILQRARFETMCHLIQENIALQATSKNRQLSLGYFFVSNAITDRHLLDSVADSMSTFPLYTYFESELAEDIKQVNFTSKFIKFLKVRKLSSKTPEQILAYIYAILYSPAYREKYYEFLKIDFPRIPFTQDIKLFDKLSEIGQYLIDLHLLKIDFETSIVSFPVENPNLKVENIKYNEGKVYINLTTYFDNVSLDVWNYYIGGYQVLYKWLKERKKHHYTLTIDDVRHFMKVCDVLNETIKIQQKIDFLTKEWI